MVPFQVGKLRYTFCVHFSVITDTYKMCKFFIYLVPDYVSFIEIAKKINEGFDALSPSKKKIGVGDILC